MSKITNKRQIELLLNHMQMKPDIARGFYKCGKEDLNKFWRVVEEDLNAAGPPSKNVSEWKKVWADQKKYVRQKAAQNLKASKGTGGGPNVEQKFSATEEAIYHLIGMKESVEGVANVFGLRPSISSAAKRTAEAPPPPTETIDVFDLEVNPEELEEVSIREPPQKQNRKSEQPASKPSSVEVLAEELSIQKDMRGIMKKQQRRIKKMHRSMDQHYDLQKRHFEFMEKAKKEEMEEKKRHNLAMEQLRLMEIENCKSAYDI